MSYFIFNSNELVLLLGEGNFSFSLALIHLSKNQLFSNIYSSCYENDIVCEDTLNNIDKLKSNGFNVIFGVDATKLSQHPEIGTKRFSKIIFNFPHIKGKMKINLNRDLIKDFFISSKSILADNGKVIVTLCSGQGGTQFEKNPRKWENTWQVVEMAAHGDYILSNVDLFPNEIFPEYISSGFRGKNKSFNTMDALIHEFSQVSPPVCSIDKSSINYFLDYHPIQGYESIKVPLIYSKLLHKNPFDNDSPQNYFKKVLISCLSSDSPQSIIVDLPLTVSYEENLVACKLNNEVAYLRNSLIKVINENNFNSGIYCGIVFNPLTSNFSICPINCEILLIGSIYKNICYEFCKKLKNKFPNAKLEWTNNDQDEKLISFNVQGETKDLIVIKHVKINENDADKCIINLDYISMCLLKIENWKQLWSVKSKFILIPSVNFKVPSLSYQTYSFDINFIINPKFNIENFINVLWQIGDNMVSAVLLLNTYEDIDKQTICHCYRIMYKSYERPLFRKRVVTFHENVVSKALQLLYNVVIS